MPLLLESRFGRSEGELREQGMREVVVEMILAEKYIVFLVVLLEKVFDEGCRWRRLERGQRAFVDVEGRDTGLGCGGGHRAGWNETQRETRWNRVRKVR